MKTTKILIPSQVTPVLTATCIVLTILLLPITSSNAQDFDDVRLTNNNEDRKEQANQRPERITVIAPRYLRPRSDYHVLINLANSEQPAAVDVTLTGARDSDREQTEAKSLLVNSGETQTLKFSIGDWPPAEYILSVNAQANDRSWNFTDEKSLKYHAKSYSSLIQTDKAIYKPGQLVQFRAIFLTENFTPLPMKDEINVTVSDPKRNIIKQWLGQSNYRGLLSLDMQLSEDPMLGDYSIKVEARNQQMTKNFRVAEYILPTFDVNIQLPNFATYNDSDIVATIKASYTYGKPVNGHVTLTVQPLIRYLTVDTRPLDQAQFRSRLTKGSADINVDLVKDLNHLRSDLFEREIEFFALVEEDLTGRKYNKTQVMKIYSNNIKIERINREANFKPGLSHLTQLKVAYQDDTPVEDNGPELEIQYSAEGKLLEKVKVQPAGGIAEHVLQTPKKVNSTRYSWQSLASSDELVVPRSIRMEVVYRGQKHYLDPIDSYNSLSEQYMQVSLPQLQRSSTGGSRRVRRPSSAASVGDELKVKVKATEPMQQINCQGLARGDIVWALNPDAKNETEFEFEIKVDQRMAPESSILCFYTRPENKEIIADSIKVTVNGLTRNQLVKLSTSRDEAKPGQEVEVGVATKPNSLVGVLGIDQSVLLLRSGNDITTKDLADEVKSYSARDSSSGAFAAKNADVVFDQADLVVLTNNLLYKGEMFPSLMMGVRKYQMMAMAAASPVRADSIALDGSRLLATDQEVHPPEYHLNRMKEEQLVIRSKFPETWLWENATAGSDGRAYFKSRMPDTITSWIISAFALNENSGLGISTSRTSVRVFRPFFIKLNLPYSIIRGETVSIQAIVFNYQKRPTAAKVILENNQGDFEFVEAANNLEDENRVVRSSETRLVRIPAEDGVSVTFLIRPRKLGSIDIRMIAQSENAGDGVVQKLLVKAEGQTQYLNKALLINLAPPESGMSKNYTIEVPANAVPGSQKVFVSAVGDIMGPGLSNVDDLLRIPYGCGEQNMINLVPNIVILNYLQNTHRLRDAQRAKAVQNIETGYQRELNYKRSDGSFSAFGNSDNNGSVWLTAYVLKTFQMAQGIITVDEKVVRRAANFIARFSRSDGSIEEVGMVHDKQLQSIAKNSASTYITAYSMIALLQRPIAPSGDSPAPVPLDEVLDRGLGFLERQLDEAVANENPYELAIIAYTLQLANRQASASRAYGQLWTKVQEDRDMAWWESKKPPVEGEDPTADSARRAGDNEEEREFESIGKSTTSTVPPLKPAPENKKQSAHLLVPESLSIEMTALALLTTVKRGELDRALPIVKWLIGQQNSNGGFASTQDTVLAIEALATFAEATMASRPAPSLDIELLYPRNQKSEIRKTNSEQLTIARSNALVNQQIRLPDNITWVQVQANGSGVAVLQVSWQYNLLVSAEQPAFYLNPIIDKSSNINYLQLSVCTFYKAGESSNMALMEVELPSGYTADAEALPGLRRQKEIKRIDTAQGDTKVMIYLDKVTRDEICITVPAHRTSKVSNNKPVPVSIYDYYNRQQAARIFYEPHLATSCDICESDSCSETCSKKPKRSDRLVSLHEQRKLNLLQSPNNKFANLTAPSNGGSGFLGQSPATVAAGNYSILPLAPVLVSLVAAARNLYQ